LPTRRSQRPRSRRPFSPQPQATRRHITCGAPPPKPGGRQPQSRRLQTAKPTDRQAHRPPSPQTAKPTDRGTDRPRNLPYRPSQRVSRTRDWQHPGTPARATSDERRATSDERATSERRASDERATSESMCSQLLCCGCPLTKLGKTGQLRRSWVGDGELQGPLGDTPVSGSAFAQALGYGCLGPSRRRSADLLQPIGAAARRITGKKLGAGRGQLPWRRDRGRRSWSAGRPGRAPLRMPEPPPAGQADSDAVLAAASDHAD
jgi:hypothetical protein